jgi:hypothetical protein
MARVRVSDELWAEFRVAAGWQPINLYLGELVRREVDRHRSRRARAGQLEDRELVDALERARELHEQLSALIHGLERRLDRLESGGTTGDRRSHGWADQLDRPLADPSSDLDCGPRR